MLSFLYGPTLTSVLDYWKNHSFDYENLGGNPKLCLEEEAASLDWLLESTMGPCPSSGQSSRGPVHMLECPYDPMDLSETCVFCLLFFFKVSLFIVTLSMYTKKGARQNCAGQ